jgi:DNA-binding NarL/FixJ family response regulator
MKGQKNEAPQIPNSHGHLLGCERLQANFRMNPSCKWPLSVMMIGGSNGLRVSLRAMVRQEPGFCLAGEAETGAAALGLVFRLQPAVALVDVCLPDRNGFEVVKCIKQLVPTCAAIVLSDAPDPCVEDVARIIGVAAVWHKGSGVNQLRKTLRRLVQGVLAQTHAELTFQSIVP